MTRQKNVLVVGVSSKTSFVTVTNSLLGSGRRTPNYGHALIQPQCLIALTQPR
ncbi:hypothetical protein [Neolewinella persica]|uniref:hypothetical protein n=1 Tax=Neolewinella persica TaxID=70998 RepID=UPI001B7F7B96|nr:hypothetical protein [Neolewinella persica]